MPHFTTTDGTRLAYEDYGSGEPIVFVASWVLDADMWEYQIPFFAERGYRCIALDRRGNIAMPFTTEGMLRAAIGADGRRRLAIYR